MTQTPPPVQPGSLVLLTGINGHVASCIALRLLERGYRVRGTVRSMKKGKYIQEVLKRFGNKLEIVEVGGDISKPGTFDEVIKGVDAVVHTSAPTTLDATDPNTFLTPAIEGTLSIMRSAKATPSVKRFLWLGSLASAVLTEKDPHKEILTRDDWNVQSTEKIKDPNDPFLGLHIYFASKTEGEKAAFRFVEEEKPQFSVTTILGAFLVGPVFKELTEPPRMDQTLGAFHAAFADPPRLPGISDFPSVAWAHVYDAADLFVAALTSSKTINIRLIACAGRTSWDAMGKIMQKKYPNRYYPPVSEDAPAMKFYGMDALVYDTALEEELLGGKWRSLEEAVLSCGRDLIEKEKKGWDKL